MKRYGLFKLYAFLIIIKPMLMKRFNEESQEDEDDKAAAVA